MENLSADHVIFDFGFTLGNYYFRIDTSSISGIFLDDLIGETKDIYLAKTNIGVGLLLYNYPLKITDTMNIVFGFGGSLDSISYDIKSQNINGSIGGYGFSLLSDFQLGESLNIFTEYYNSGSSSGGSRNEIRTKISYKVYGNLHLSLTASFNSTKKENGNKPIKLNASTYSLGLYMN